MNTQTNRIYQVEQTEKCSCHDCVQFGLSKHPGSTMKTFHTEDAIFEVSNNSDLKCLEVLEQCRKNGTRITLDLGNTETGESWNEKYDVTGYVGRSTGRVKLFLLIANSNSHGGGAILTGSILSIRHANKKNGGLIYSRGSK